MKTAELRRVMKSIDPELRVSSVEYGWAVRTGSHRRLKQLRAMLSSLMLREFREMEIKGSRYDWTYVLFVAGVDDEKA